MGDYEEVFDPILGRNRAKDLFTGSGLLSINGLTPVAQLLAVASAGSDFNVVSSGATHTFNLPTASALNRGALSSTDWSTFNNKLSNISGQNHSTLNNLDYASAGHTGFEKSLTFSTGLTRTVDTIKTNDSQINHDNLLNFVAGEHFLQSAITQISAGVGDGLVKSTSGTLSAITDNSTNWNTAYSWGDHAGLYDTIGTASGLISTHESTYDHSLIATALQNIVEDTSPQLGNDLDTNAFDIKFLDNDKAIFGTGLDFEIYSDGNDAILRQLTQDREIKFYTNDGGVDKLKATINGGAIALEVFGIIQANQGVIKFTQDGAAAVATGEVFSNTITHTPALRFIRGLGTKASPLAIISGTRIGSFQAVGYYDSSNSSRQAELLFTASENWSATNRGTNVCFQTTENGTTTKVERLCAENDGNITLRQTAGGQGAAVAKFEEKDTTPSNPTAGTEVKMYMKDDKIIFQYNDAGTVRYKYLDLTGTGVTWVHTTTAP